MDIFFISIIIILVVLLIFSFQRNSSAADEKEYLLLARDAALGIADRVVSMNASADIYQYLLESCLKLIPKAAFGSILMFHSDGLLAAKASVGFNADEISRFRLKLEDSFLYIATGGKLDQTVILNRLEDVIQSENTVKSMFQGLVIKSEASSPLYSGGELVGLLCVDGDRNDIFTEQDISTLDYIAKQISIVVNNQKLYGEIQRLSRYDTLSNLLNRNSFEQEAVRLLNDPSRDAENLYFVLMDLDDLKAANDISGQIFGDELIKSFSELISGRLGKNDFCGRYGGDEFAAVIQGGSMYVNQLLEESQKEFLALKNKIRENDFTPGFRYGKASFQEGRCNLDALYQLADSRMEEVKKKQQRTKPQNR